MINFLSGGMMGDFIQTLYVVKNICQERNDKANLYLVNEGDIWKHGIQKAYNDLEQLIKFQPYINSFQIKTKELAEPYINLNDWRLLAASNHAKKDSYDICWSDLLFQFYQFNISKRYQWLNAVHPNIISRRKIVIHRSVHRHNNNFPWQYITSDISHRFLFLTSYPIEYSKFPFKNSNVELCQVDTINDMTNVIASCDMFIGNQSAPFSIACALDVPRLVELAEEPAGFYMDETKYSSNISWFLNNNTKYISPNSLIKL